VLRRRGPGLRGAGGRDCDHKEVLRVLSRLTHREHRGRLVKKALRGRCYSLAPEASFGLLLRHRDNADREKWEARSWVPSSAGGGDSPVLDADDLDLPWTIVVVVDVDDDVAVRRERRARRPGTKDPGHVQRRGVRDTIADGRTMQRAHGGRESERHHHVEHGDGRAICRLRSRLGAHLASGGGPRARGYLALELLRVVERDLIALEPRGGTTEHRRRRRGRISAATTDDSNHDDGE